RRYLDAVAHLANAHRHDDDLADRHLDLFRLRHRDGNKRFGADDRDFLYDRDGEFVKIL
ncbi:unnamed protein product, partial [Rotaria sp. Silwood1]